MASNSGLWKLADTIGAAMIAASVVFLIALFGVFEFVENAILSK
jgi:hypothetical protein